MTVAPTTVLAVDLQSRARLAGYEPERLDAAVLVVGAGALGQNTALNLALSGVRELRVIDADRFEAHNRTRSPLYPVGGDTGLPKAPSTAAALARIATHERAVVRFADAWIEELGAAVFDGVAVVVSCVDALRARAYLADRCALLGLPLVEAGFEGPEVSLAVFPVGDPAATACWRCGGSAVASETMSCRIRATAAEAAGIIPAIQTAAAVLGGLQAEAVVEVLHGRSERARRSWLDIRTGEGLAADLSVSARCPGPHRRLPPAQVAQASIATPLAELLELAQAHLAGEATIELPAPWAEEGLCARCGSVVQIEASGPAYTRAPYCQGCGGPWPITTGAVAPSANPVSRVRRGDPLAQRPAGAVGYAPGDHVALSAGEEELVLRLSGGLEDLLTVAVP